MSSGDEKLRPSQRINGGVERREEVIVELRKSADTIGIYNIFNSPNPGDFKKLVDLIEMLHADVDRLSGVVNVLHSKARGARGEAVTNKRRKFAESTSVPIGRTQDALRRLVLDRGALGWAIGEDEGRAVIQFRLNGRVLRFRINLMTRPTEMEQKRGVMPRRVDADEERRLWRAIHMAVKAKLVIAEDGIESFDEVFLANIVTPDGDTIGERVGGQIPAMVSDSRPIALLSDGRR